MKKILLAVIIFISAFSVGYSQCTKPASVEITSPSVSTYTMCQGTPLTLSGTVTVPSASQNGGFTYSWIKAGTINVVLQTATIPLSINTPTAVPAYTGITGVLADAGKYILRVEDGNAANSSCFTDDTITIAVHATVTPGMIGTAQTICNGSVPAGLTQTVAAGGGTGVFSYAWETSVNSGAYTIIASATNATYNSSVLINSGITPMTIDIRRTAISGVCPPAAAPPVRITVNPSVVAGVIASDQTICSGGDPAAFTQTTAATGGSGVYTYQWESSVTNAGAWTNIAGATNATYDAPAGLSATTYYRRQDASSICATAHTNAITVTVTPTKTPSVAISVSPNTTICAGTSVTFTATPTNGGTAPTYQWIRNAVYISGATNATYTTTTATNNDSYNVVMTSNANCPSPATATSNAIVMTVTTVVTPSVTLSASPQSICPGQSVTFTATPGNGGTVPAYEWFINNASQGVAGSSSIFTTSALTSSSDVVKVVLTSNVACTVAPGTATASKSVTVNTGIGAGTIASNQTICYNTVPAAITEIAAPTGLMGSQTYTWEASLDGVSLWVAIPGATNATYTPTVPLIYDVYIRRVITDPGTPAPCNTATSNVIHITVRPELTAGVIGSDETICSGTNPAAITQITSPTGGTGTYTYQWQLNTSGAFINVAGETGANYTPSALTVTTQFQRIETSGICGSVTSNVVTKTVTAPEVVTAVIDNAPTQVCATGTIVFTANGSSTTGTGTLHYLWELGAVSVGTDNPTYTYTIAAADNGKILSVKVSTSTACNAGSSSAMYTLDIVNSTTPTVSIVSNNNPTCLGMPVTFTATSTGMGNAPTYQWYVVASGAPAGTVGTTLGTGGTTYSNSSLLNGDRVYVTLTSSLACLTGPNPFKSNEITMLVKPMPAPVINEGDQTVCAPNSFTYHATVGVGSTYQWILNAHPINSATIDSYTATQSGTYSITEDNGTCNATSAPVQFTVDPCGAFSTSISGPNPITPGQQNAVYSVVNQTGFTYTWSVTGGTIVSGQNTNSVTVDWDASNAFARTTAAGYSISVVETNPSNQTKKTKLTINTLTTGTALTQAQAGIKLFPNPTTGSFNIEMPESGMDVSYEVLDLTGLVVASGTFTSNGSNQNIDANFGAGMYQVILKYDNVVTCVRLSKIQ